MKFVERNKENKEWFVVALEKEFMSDTLNIAYSDVGKVNAAMTTQKLIDVYHPTKITNVGTAGGHPIKTQVGQVYAIGKVTDRDLNIPGRPFPQIQTATPGTAICCTGDTFVTKWANTNYKIVDMEAYAIAAVCKLNNVPFECYKYISDSGNDADWENSLLNCNRVFQKMLHKKQENVK